MCLGDVLTLIAIAFFRRGFWERMWDNPFVPIGAVTTGAVLGSGLMAFFKGNQNTSQRMMRFRVVAQGN